MKKNSESPASFESALNALEGIVSQMESGQLPLEQSLAAYKQGVELLRYCQQTLKDSEQQIRLLDEQGNLQPLGND